MDFRVIAQVSTDDVGDFAGRTFTVFHTSEVDVHGNDVGTIGLHTCERVIRVCLAERIAAYLDFRNFRTDSVIQFSCKFPCNLLRCTGIELDGHCKTSLVGIREIFILDMRSEEKQHGHEDTERAENNGLPVTHRPVDNLGIAIGNSIETLVYRRKQYIVKLALLLACTEHS